MPPISSDTPTEAFLIDLYDRIQVLGSDEPGSATQGPLTADDAVSAWERLVTGAQGNRRS